MFLLKKVKFSYAGHEILSNINLSLAQGSFTAIIGGNGSGKSTLARLLGGIFQPTEGSCFFKDSPIKNEALSQMTGLLLSNPADQFFAPLVEDDIAFGLENQELPPSIITKEVEKALTRFNLQHLRKKQVQNLSAGQQQKVALAGITAWKPTLLILDEPLAYLDQKEQRDVMTALQSLRSQQQITIVMFTHYLYWTLQADQYHILSNGQLTKAYTIKDPLPLAQFQEERIAVPEIISLQNQIKQLGLSIPFLEQSYTNNK